MIYEVEFQISPAMPEKTVMSALHDEPYNVFVYITSTGGYISVECGQLDEMRGKLQNLAAHIEDADASKQYVIDFEFKVEMTF